MSVSIHKTLGAKEIVKLLRENAELRLDIIRRDREAAFARFEDPTATRH